MASPFKRKPALVRTYGSSSSSSHTAAAPLSKSLSALDRLLADSDSSDEEDALQTAPQAQAPTPKRANTAVKAKGEEPISRSRRSISAAAPPEDDQSRGDENQAAALSTRTRATRRSSSRGAALVDSTESRTKSSGSQPQQQRPSPRKRAAQTPVEYQQETDDSAEEEEVLSRPSPPRRKVKRTDRSSNSHAGSRPTFTGTGKPSSTTSIPTAAAKSKRAKSGKAVERDDDEIPAPTAFVPLAERLKQASEGSHDEGSSANQPREQTSSPSPPKRPRPRKAATAPTQALSASRPSYDDKSSRPTATTPLSPAKPTPGATHRPASPVKDLSAVFSRFATRTSAPPSPPIIAATTTTTSSNSSAVVVEQDEESSLHHDAASGMKVPVRNERPTAGLKRARSLVGGMAGPIAKRLGGSTRSLMPGADDPDDDGDGDRDGRLGRTHESQPGSSSVLSPPPSRPNRPRPPLGSSLSVPVLSPTKSSPVRGGGGNGIASPNPRTRNGEGGESPFRRPHSPSVNDGGNNGGLAALLGGAGLMSTDGSGPTRTYASGRRTVRAPVELEEEGGGEAFTSARTATTTSKATAVLPGSSRPQGGDACTSKASAMVAAPPRRETYASLRLLWGIDAEENLDADEDQDSQDRGAKVVGSGTLRRQGEGKRWMDELGWMCDGLRAEGRGGGEGGDRGAARASAIELVGKALEKDWIRRLKSSGQAETVYLALRTATSSSSGGGSYATPATPTMAADRVLDVAIAVTLALFVKDQRLVEPLLRISPADVQRNVATRKTASPLSSPSPRDEPGSDGTSDLLEVLTALLDREWASDEIGATTTAAGPTQTGGTSGRNRVSKVFKSDTRHVSPRVDSRIGNCGR